MKTPQVNPLAGMTPLGLPETTDQEKIEALVEALTLASDYLIQFFEEGEENDHVVFILEALALANGETYTFGKVARQVKAAPALVEALQVLLYATTTEEYKTASKQAREALALAKGGE